MAGRKIAIFGISQGGLLPRFALTYWPSLRPMVSDVLAAAGTQHGTTVGAGSCSEAVPCPPAYWQQAAGSNLLRALNRQPFEAPGPTAWTTVRSTTDETVQPTTGPHPTSALKGAANIVIQAVCPGRVTTHIGTAVDSVTFAAFADAISHRGPAKRLAPAGRRLRPPLRAGPRRSDDQRLPLRLRQPDLLAGGKRAAGRRPSRGCAPTSSVCCRVRTPRAGAYAATRVEPRVPPPR